MNTLMLQPRQLRSTISKIMAALVFASTVGAIATGPALARDDGRGEHRDEGRQRGESHYDRDRHEGERPHYYARPVYAPPPVYYVPEPSPGISLFFPLDIHIR
jgi:hypothetical protein